MRAVAALGWTVAAVLPDGSAAQDPPGPEPSSSVLAVPFVAQTELLCGGAAVEMVLRYWGERDFTAERFAPLVDRSAGGIATGDLARATGDLGWTTLPFEGDVLELRRQLDRGRPVLALVQVASGRFHYVAIVGWVGDRIVYHDPAVSPYETATPSDFDTAWSAAGRWAMLVLPAEESRAPAEEAADPPADPGDDPSPALEQDARAAETAPPSGQCGPHVLAAIEAARDGREGRAEALLIEAGMACPSDAVAVRELAALRLRQGRYGEAAALARRARGMAPESQSLRLLAAARYLGGEEVAALDAWSRLGPMRVDWVNFVGVSRTSARRIASRADLSTTEPLSAERLRTARRRVAQLPTLARARVDYTPLDSGRVEVDISVREKRPWPVSPADGVRSAWDAAFHARVRLEAAGPLGLDEQWRLEWRWEAARRRLRMGLAVPGTIGLPGVLSLTGGRERHSFAGGREERREAALGFAAWPASRVRLEASAGWERFSARGSWLRLAAEPALALVGDRLLVRSRGQAWLGFDERTDFLLLETDARWQSDPGTRGFVWRLRAGGSLVTTDAPMSTWPGAGEGTTDVPLLRAHRLVQGGRVGGPVFGRRLLHGGAEALAWGIDAPLVRIATAAFLDLGLAGARPEDAPGEPFQADVGLGLRIDAPGVGRLRIDVARGLVDGDVRLSAGLERGWEVDP